MSPDRAYRATMGLFATGVTVITVGHQGVRHGMTASAVMSVSLRPQLLAVAVDNRSHTNEMVQRAGHFTVNILAEGQAEVARRFARPMAREAELFGAAPTTVGPAGDPVLPATLAHLSCEVTSVHEEGDHTLYVGRVTALWRTPEATAPLIFYAGRFCSTSCRVCIARVDPTEALYALHGG
ncbi:flavin reductase family protein [Acrocarpospora macrocephala]|uniref:Flavin reductase n=1 Tax=Acrocarpospora macrocephala TaxID=150177 RepID=A0A5M3X0L4_9ACTN|nr:flavin reductase family protein [Acrocarpospora macrocephala]GES11818.1 flavin reductase [Acrocarpospora macrocephala]